MHCSNIYIVYMLWMKPCTYIEISKTPESQIPWNCLLHQVWSSTAPQCSSPPAEWAQFCCSPVLLYQTGTSARHQAEETWSLCARAQLCDGNNPPHLHERRQRQGGIENKNGKTAVREKSKKSWRRKERSKFLITTPWVQAIYFEPGHLWFHISPYPSKRL